MSITRSSAKNRPPSLLPGGARHSVMDFAFEPARHHSADGLKSRIHPFAA